MFYYVVLGTRIDDGIEEIVKIFDSDMNLTDAEAREAAMEYELIVRCDEKYSDCRVDRKTVVLK
jgi:hypothetical protein